MVSIVNEMVQVKIIVISDDIKLPLPHIHKQSKAVLQLQANKYRVRLYRTHFHNANFPKFVPFDHFQFGRIYLN